MSVSCPAIPTPFDEMSVAEFATARLANLGFETYAGKLTAAWRNIGEPEPNQKASIEEIAGSIRAILDTAVTISEQRREEIESLITRKTENINNLKAELGEAVDISAPAFAFPSAELALIQQLHLIEEVEVKLITERQAWVDKVDFKRKAAAAICHALGMPVDAKFAEIGALSPQRVAAFDGHINFLEQTVAERQAVIAGSVASIKEYWRVLETTPSTDMERSVADETCDLGVHIEVIEALQQMKADLDLECVSLRGRVRKGWAGCAR
jgi:hypothetical protein